MAVSSTTEANYIIRGKFKDGITNNAKRAFKSLQRAAKTAFKVVSIGIASAVAGFALLVRSGQSASLQFEQLQNTLKSVAGSSEEAGKEFAFISSEANRLGLDLSVLATDYVKLTAASKGTVLQGKKTQEIFSSIAEASVVLGLSADQQSGALTAIQQIMSKGVVSAEELRGQLGERLPGAFQIAARAMGVTTRELGKMLQAGELLSVDFLPKFAEQLRTEFAGGLKNATDSTLSNINRMKTSFNKFLITIGDFINGNEKVKEIIKNVSEAFKAFVVKLKENKDEITAAVTEAIEKITAGFRSLVIGTAIAFDAMKPVFTFISSAFNGLLNFFNGLPPIIREIGIVGVLVGGPYVRVAIAAIALITQNFEWLINKAKEAWNWIKKIIGLSDPNSVLSKGLASVGNFVGANDPDSMYSKFSNNLSLMGGDIKDFANDVTTWVKGIPSIAETILPANKGTMEKLAREFVGVQEKFANIAKQTFVGMADESKKTAEKMADSMKTGTESMKKSIVSVGETSEKVHKRIVRNSLATASAMKVVVKGMKSLNSQGSFTQFSNGSPGTIKLLGSSGFSMRNTGAPIPNLSRGIKGLSRFSRQSFTQGNRAGLNEVPYDMVTKVHKGEKILNKFDAQDSGGGVRIGKMTIQISGENKTPKEMALEIYDELGRIGKRRAA